MAKKKNNKSEKIRAYLNDNPGAVATDVAKTFGVSKGLVYNVKSSLKQGSRRKKASRGKRTKAVRTSRNGAPAMGQSAEQLVQAARLIKACGSVKEAERALRTAGLVAGTLA